MKKPLEFGICMAGCEAEMEAQLRRVASQFPSVHYLEIGIGWGGTLTSMAYILNDCCKTWRAIGLDIPEGYSLNLDVLGQRALGYGLTKEVNHTFPDKPNPINNIVSVYLKNSQDFLRDNWSLPIHFGLIDGCHGKACVKADFELMSKFVPVGGVIVFHDFGQDSVGEPQPHCGIGDTLGACKDMGLLDGRCHGWKHVSTVVGDKSKIGRDIGVFERTA